MVKEITELSELTTALDEHDVVVVDYWATWCGPCVRIAPFYKELNEKYEDVCFLKVDVDEAEDLTTSQEIQCMPTFHIYKNKERVGLIKGANKDLLEETIKKCL
jgi:thioredoxin 1